LPDGCIDLIFRRGAEGGRLFASALIEQPAFFTGNGSAWFVGVRFRPAMARAILEVEPVDCRDRDIPAASIDPDLAGLEDRLSDCASAAAALALLRHAVDARLAQTKRDATPMRVREAIALLERGGGDLHVRKVAQSLGIAERSLHRDLVRWSGLAPKSMARILRMQRTLYAIRADRQPLAELALHLGYADQAHMTRELKALSGFTPAELSPRIARTTVRNLQDAA
ncbi:MAG TPA: AraC family transcriptional regulator, partial [Dongiaceae bacterium]